MKCQKILRTELELSKSNLESSKAIVARLEADLEMKLTKARRLGNGMSDNKNSAHGLFTYMLFSIY